MVLRRLGLALTLSSLLMSCGGETPVCPPAATGGEASVISPAAKPVAAASKKPTTTTPKKKPATSTKPTASPKPGASAAPVEEEEETPAIDAMAQLEEVKTTTLSQPGMTATIATSENLWNNTLFVSSSFKLWVQGKSYRLENIAHSSPSKVGAKVVLKYGETTARVKPTGLLSLVTVTLPLADKNLISQNGITLDKILSHGVLERVTGGGYKAEIAGTTMIGSDKITIIKVTPSGVHPLSEHAVYEYVGFDDAKLYRHWSLYGKPELGLPNNQLYQILVKDSVPGATIPADTFKL